MVAPGERERVALVGFAAVLCACATLLGIDKNYFEADAGDADGGAAAGDSASDTEAGDANTFKCPTIDASAGYVFCDDFDETPLGANWSAVTNKNGSVALDTSKPISPPNAFLSTLDLTDASVEREGKLTKTFIAARAIDCRFSVQVVTLGTDPMRFFSIDVTNPTFTAYELNVYIDPSAYPYVQEWAGFTDGGSYSADTPLPAAFVTGAWVDVELSIEYGNAIHVWIDGSPAASQSALAQTPQGESVLLGAFSIGTSAWKVLFDDLACVVTL